MRDHYLRKNCRLCKSTDIQIALPLHKSPLCDAYLKEVKKQEFYDLNLCLCNECGFVQLDTIIDPDTIYRDYIYVTTSSSGLENHFKKYSEEVCDLLDLKGSKLTVDIGSNDGTLLKFLKKRGHEVLGVDPSYSAAESAIAGGINTLPEFFDLPLAEKIVNDHGQAELITVNNLFANIDLLHDFVSGLDILLSDEGVLVVESSYLLDMIKNMVFDFIYHEHLSYFSIFPLQKFFETYGLHLIGLEHIGTKGGSLRYYWARFNSKWEVDKNVTKIIEKEKKANINISTFRDFEEKIAVQGSYLSKFLEKFKGKKVVGYGASATSTTLISHFQLQKYITYLVDDNPDKIGTFSPGYHIPVFHSEKIFEENPDVIIILAWRYKDEIIKKLSTKSKVIVPLPEFSIER